MVQPSAKKINVLETTLRDGSYAVNFSFTAQDTAMLCRALEEAGFEYIEIGHGVGLNADPAKHGKAMASDEDYMAAASGALSTAKYGMFCIPGIARLEDIDLAKKYRMGFIRIGTDVSQVEKSEDFIKKAKDAGMFVAANYMKSSAAGPEEFASKVPLSEKWGADLIYVVDSAGGMFPSDHRPEHSIRDYFQAIRRVSNLPFGFHGHNNLDMVMPNCLEAIEAGADFVDSSLQGLGRSAGNACTEILVAMLKKRGYTITPKLLETLYVGQEFIYPIRPMNKSIDIMCGYADFHSSYMPHILESASKFNADPHILIEEYAKVDKVNIDDSRLNEIASRFEGTNRRFLGKLKFGTYLGREQE